MQTLLKVLKWGFIPVSAAVFLLGLISLVRDARTLGWPSWVWLLVGYLMTALSFGFVIVGFWRDSRRLKMNQGRQARQERVKHRLQYKNANRLPMKLLEFHKTCQRFMKDMVVSKKAFESAMPLFKQAMSGHKMLLFSLILKMPMGVIARVKPIQRVVYKFIFEVDTVLKSANIDTLSDNEEYKRLYDEIHEYSLPLPAATIRKITAYVLFVNILDMTFIFRPSQPFMRKTKIPSKTRSLLAYHTFAVDTQLANMRALISTDINRFFEGE